MILRGLVACALLASFMLCTSSHATAHEIKAGILGAFLEGDVRSDTQMVLIIPGSGAVNRDGNLPLAGMKPAIYKRLAEGLAEHGISSVRIDKRGMFSSAAPEVNPNAASMEIYADDVRIWVNYLKQEYDRECIWLLGHSEGGIVSLLAASQSQEGICGVILAATPGRKLGIVLREQMHRLLADTALLPAALAAIDSLEQGKTFDTATMPSPLRSFFRQAVQPGLIDMLRQDPASLLTPLTVPVLILQGEKDNQVTQEDAQALHSANPGTSLVLLPKVTHMLKEQPTGISSHVTYVDPDLPIAEMVIEKIAAFISGNKENTE